MCVLLVIVTTTLQRRYPIEELAEHGDMVDCAHLLLRGTLPTQSQRLGFDADVAQAEEKKNKIKRGLKKR